MTKDESRQMTKDDFNKYGYDPIGPEAGAGFREVLIEDTPKCACGGDCKRCLKQCTCKVCCHTRRVK